jgi:hypothetical protein
VSGRLNSVGSDTMNNMMTLLNLTAIIVRTRLRRRYQTSAF